MHFYIIPQLQLQQRITEIKDNYYFGNYKEAILKCQELIQESGDKQVATFWLGKSYDGLAQKISANKKRVKTLRQWASSQFFSDQQRQRFAQQVDNITAMVKTWQQPEILANKAVACYQKVLAATVNWSQSVDIAEAHLQAKRYPQALAILDKLPPSSQPGTNLYTRLLRLETNLHQARQQQQKLDRFEPECLEVIRIYHQIASEHQKVKPGNIGLLYFYLAEINEGKGQRQQAEKYYAGGCAIDSGSPMVWYRRGKNLAELKQMNQAEYALMRAMNLSRQRAWPDVNMPWLKFACNYGKNNRPWMRCKKD